MGIDDVASGGAKIAQLLIPPTDGDPKKRLKYDLTVSALLFFGGALMTVHVLWICGWLTILGFAEPYAYAGDVNNLQMRVVSLQASRLDNDLRDAKTKICLAVQQRNQTVLDAWGRILEQVKQQYRDQLGREPHVLDCSELLINGPTNPTAP